MLVLFSLVFVTYRYKDVISNFIVENIIYFGSNKVLSYNMYYQDTDYKFVQNIDTNKVNNYQELLNMFYTIINSGDLEYSFICNYDSCIENVNKLSTDGNIISNINNFVHPFNSFEKINLNINNNGKITVKITPVYTEEEKIFVETYLKKYIQDNINNQMSTRDKIKVFHDYIINNTIYDSEEKFDKSYTAYGLLMNNIAICGGYSDITSVYLNLLGIQNIRIATDAHIWNLVNVDGTWLHLDLTWDDPVSNDGNQYLLNNYFLINTQQLKMLDSVDHNFYSNIYLEAN